MITDLLWLVVAFLFVATAVCAQGCLDSLDDLNGALAAWWGAATLLFWSACFVLTYHLI